MFFACLLTFFKYINADVPGFAPFGQMRRIFREGKIRALRSVTERYPRLSPAVYRNSIASLASTDPTHTIMPPSPRQCRTSLRRRYVLEDFQGLRNCSSEPEPGDNC